MDIEELILNSDFEFECNISDKYKDVETDEWGCAFACLDDIGVEYNFCIDDGINSCAIYKIKFDKETECMETDYDTFIHYEIDFDKEDWVQRLKNAMCKALIEFYNL